MDVLTKAQRSYCMSQIRAKNTKPEMMLRKSLWALGFRYRLHCKLPGKPDIAFSSLKVAVFVDGCFWHGCPEHGVKPKTNTTFWLKKIKCNIERDAKNNSLLEKSGWTVLRFWEHEIKQDILSIIEKIAEVINLKRS